MELTASVMVISGFCLRTSRTTSVWPDWIARNRHVPLSCCEHGPERKVQSAMCNSHYKTERFNSKINEQCKERTWSWALMSAPSDTSLTALALIPDVHAACSGVQRYCKSHTRRRRDTWSRKLTSAPACTRASITDGVDSRAAAWRALPPSWSHQKRRRETHVTNGDVGVTRSLEEKTNNFQMLCAGGHIQGRSVFLKIRTLGRGTHGCIAVVCTGFVCQKKFHDFLTSLACRHVQSRVPILSTSMDFSEDFKEREEDEGFT
jgi:hypothetical protein